MWCSRVGSTGAALRGGRPKLTAEELRYCDRKCWNLGPTWTARKLHRYDPPLAWRTRYEESTWRIRQMIHLPLQSSPIWQFSMWIKREFYTRRILPYIIVDEMKLKMLKETSLWSLWVAWRDTWISREYCNTMWRNVLEGQWWGCWDRMLGRLVWG